MRVVVYDEESLEPITVVNLPGLTDRCLEERQIWRVASFHSPQSEPQHDEASAKSPAPVRFVDLEFERISRVTLRHGEQTVWMCLTRAADLAMLLTPDWLPGQRTAMQQLQRESERLADLVVRSLTRE
jgi:hypothetical protein